MHPSCTSVKLLLTASYPEIPLQTPAELLADVFTLSDEHCTTLHSWELTSGSFNQKPYSCEQHISQVKTQISLQVEGIKVTR